jgi:serine/threonine protein kinase
LKTFRQFWIPIWVLPVAIAGLVALFGWWGNERLRATIEGELQTQLSATLNANVTALGIWATNQTRLAMALADDPVVRQSATAILQAPPPRREGRPLTETGTFLEELRPRLAPLGYRYAQLVDTNMLVRVSSLRPQTGNVVSDAHTNKFALLLATGQPVIITPFRQEMLTQQRRFRDFPPDSGNGGPMRQFGRRTQAAAAGSLGNQALMQVAAPVRNDAGAVVGALALIIDPDKEFSHIISVARLGSTGETYAFDQTGLMISQSRFVSQLKRLGLLNATNSSSALNLRLNDPGGDLTRGFKVPEHEPYVRLLTRLAASAINGENEVDAIPARDYRGVPVVGASCWLPRFGFGVATQIDANEAFRPLRVLQVVFVVLVLSLLLCATGMFVFSYASLSWRQRLNAMELKLKQLGQYTLEEKVGEGGMGVVYRAKHALLRRDTAVKLLLPGRANEAAIARFEREVCLTCQLTHPNTIQVYDYGHTPEGIFYYAMEFLRGVNLHDLVVRFGPQPEGRVIHILAQVCASLAEAHALGLIHRDIKPGNVFLCRRGGVPDCVKVLDFGLVRDFRSADPEPVDGEGDRVIEGTAWFMPPEAVQAGATTDPRSDIYSLGAVGYFMLTRSYIFDAESVDDIQQKQLDDAPVPPTRRTANPISAEMEQLLLQCLEKDRDRRPQSANELREALLALEAAAEWTTEASTAWWKDFESKPTSAASGAEAEIPSALPTLSVDLAGRMK